MNKKFLVVALMAALSTVGYAFNHGDINYADTEFADAGKVDKVFGEIQTELDGKASQTEVDAIQGALEGANKEFDKINSKLDGKASQTEVDAIQGALEGANKEFDRINGELDGKADKDYVDGKVTELGDHVREEMDTVRGEIGGVKAEVYENKENIAANKAEIERLDKENKTQDGRLDAVEDKNNKQDAAIKDHGDRLGALESNYAQYDGRLSGLEKKVDHLDDKMNKGLSLMAAMNAVDFQNVQTGEMALGAGIGHYGNAQSVALGVAYAPVEDLTVNAKYSITAGDPDSFAVGAGATYKFKVGR